MQRAFTLHACLAFRWLMATLFVSLVLSPPPEAGAATYRVNASQTATCANQDGLSWGSAFKYLQDAIAEAEGGGPDEIWVAEGTYKPHQSCAGTGDRFVAFDLINVTLLGGFPSNLTGGGNVTDRNPSLFVTTILDGDLGNDDEPGFVNYDDNSLHVVTVTSATEGDTVTVDGFRITAGNADGDSGVAAIGGGVLLNSGGTLNVEGPTFRNVTFDLNRADGAGGGLGGRKMQVRLVDCLFELTRRWPSLTAVTPRSTTLAAALSVSVPISR